MNATLEYDLEVTKWQIAGILRRANIVRFRKVTGGQSRLRDVKANVSYYGGIEVTEIATAYNVNGKNMRPKYVKETTGKFTINFVQGYEGKHYESEEANAILKEAIAALIADGFTVVHENFLGYTVAKVAR